MDTDIINIVMAKRIPLLFSFQKNLKNQSTIPSPQQLPNFSSLVAWVPGLWRGGVWSCLSVWMRLGEGGVQICK